MNELNPMPALPRGAKVFAITQGGILLGEVEIRAKSNFEVDASLTHIRVCSHKFTHAGTANEESRVVFVYLANEANRAKLVALFGEDQVPALPPHGSEISKALLEEGRYVKACVSNISDEDARNSLNIALLKRIDEGEFVCIGGGRYHYAVAFDDFGVEITELPQ